MQTGRARRFSTIFILSMLILQVVLMAMMLFFFYGLSKQAITTAFQQELSLAASSVGFSLTEDSKALNTWLTDIATDNALRVSLRLNLDGKIREILEQKQTNARINGRFYLMTEAGVFYPEPAEKLKSALRLIDRDERDPFTAGNAHILRIDETFVAVLHQTVQVRDGKKLGELYLTHDLGSALVSSISRGHEEYKSVEPRLLLEYEQEYYNVIDGRPLNIHSADFTSANALQPIKNPFGVRLFYAIPYTSQWAKTSELLVRFVVYSLIALLATTLLAVLIIRRHSNTLHDLVRNAGRLSMSRSDMELSVQPGEFFEFQELVSSFNTILRNLRLSRDEVRHLNTELEERVANRTQELTEANVLLSASEQQLRQVVEHIPVATCMFDAQMNPLYSSLMWKELFRLSVPQNQNKHFLDLIPEYREYWEKAVADCLKGKIRHCSEKRMMIHGREYWLRWEAHPWAAVPGKPPAQAMEATSAEQQVVRDTRVGGVIVFLEDISSQKWSQDALQRAADEAGTANRLKSEFLANVSHEIRTPLNCIIGFAEIISTSEQLEGIHRQAELILSESDSLLVLINDLLDFSKIEAGKLDTDSHDFDLHQLFDDITPGVRLRLRKKPVTFSTEISPDVPRYLHGDSFRLRQVIMNLVHNAVKFTEKGYIVLNVTLNARLPGAYKLMFSVEDTGIGIPADKQKSIFEKFTQADGSTTRRYGGTGLGTTISKKLVEIMGGNIGLKSVAGKGSTFWFTLPFQLGEEPEEVASTVGADGEGAADVARVSLPILITEDYVPNQMVARAHLESEGFAVEIANNGREACEKVRAGRYALVLMDLSMPEMDGYEATESIRNIPGMGDLPIIALTASAEPSVRVKCLKAKFDDIIAKPIRKADLLTMVRKWLDHTSGRGRDVEKESELNSEESGALQADVPVAAPMAVPAVGGQSGQETVPQRAASSVDGGERGTQVFSRLAQEAAIVNVAKGEVAEEDGPIDFAALQADYPGKHTLIRRLLLQFNDLLDGQIAALQAAIASEDVETLRAESHKLVGGAGTLRANRIYDCARNINDAAKERDFVRCAQEMEIIVHQRKALAIVLQKRYEQHEE